MIGLDTNVIVRYLTRDDPDQYRAAKALMESQCTLEQPGYVTVIVLCELVWVLRGAYDVRKKDIVRTLTKMLQTSQLHIQHEKQVRAALRTYAHHPADFADCLIGQLHRDAGCEHTATFDQDASSLDAWKALG